MRISLAAVLLVIACLLPNAAPRAAGGSDEIDAELIGFLVQLPGDGLRLPTPAVAAIEVPNEQGGPRVAIPVEFTARTVGERRPHHVRSGDLVVVEGVLHQGRLRVLQVRDVAIEELHGRVSLPDGPLALPLTADRRIEVFLDGGPRVPVSFLLTSRTTSPRTSLRDGQAVDLAVVVGRRLVVDLEPARSR